MNKINLRILAAVVEALVEEIIQEVKNAEANTALGTMVEIQFKVPNKELRSALGVTRNTREVKDAFYLEVSKYPYIRVGDGESYLLLTYVCTVIETITLTYNSQLDKKIIASEEVHDSNAPAKRRLKNHAYPAIEYNGETKALSEWCRELNLTYATTRARLKAGFPIDKAFSKKIEKGNIEYNGEKVTLYRLCRLLGIDFSKTRYAIRSGKTTPELLVKQSSKGKSVTTLF